MIDEVKLQFSVILLPFLEVRDITENVSTPTSESLYIQGLKTPPCVAQWSKNAKTLDYLLPVCNF